MAKKWYAEQIGPLPLGIWLAAGAGGLALAYYENRQKKSTPVDSSTGSGSSLPTDAGFLGTGIGGSGAVGLPIGTPISTTGGGTPATGVPSTFTDNIQWSTWVQRILVGKGYDALLVAQTLSDYLAGNALSTAETQMFSIILTVVGPAPFPVALKPGPPTDTKPTFVYYPNYAAPPAPDPASVPAGYHLVFSSGQNYDLSGNPIPGSPPAGYWTLMNEQQYSDLLRFLGGLNH